MSVHQRHQICDFTGFEDWSLGRTHIGEAVIVSTLPWEPVLAFQVLGSKSSLYLSDPACVFLFWISAMLFLCPCFPVSCMVVVVFSGGGPSACWCKKRYFVFCLYPTFQQVCCDLFHGVEQVLCVCFRPLHEKTMVGVLGVS